MYSMYVLFLIAYILQLCHYIEAKCPLLSPVPNAFTRYIGTPIRFNGSEVVYDCFSNSVLISGDLVRMCIDSTYTGVEPECKISCGAPKDYFNASKSLTSSYPGDTVTYQCDFNNAITTQATCQPNGSWNYTENFLCYENKTNFALNGAVQLTLGGNITNPGAVTDGDEVTKTSIGPDSKVSFDIEIFPADTFLDIFEYAVKFNSSEEPQLTDLRLCIYAISNFDNGPPVSSICGNTKINGSATALRIQEVIPCCHHTNRIRIFGIMRIGTQGTLHIREVEVYGRRRIVDCGEPPFLFGMDVTVTQTGGYSTAEYTCKDGYFPLHSFNTYYCNPADNQWFYIVVPVCSDYAEILAMDITDNPQLFDGDDVTCVTVSNNVDLDVDFSPTETVEVDFVNIRLRDGEDFENFTVHTVYNGNLTLCVKKYDTTDGPIKTFQCRHKLATGLRIRKINSKLEICEVRIQGRKWKGFNNALECIRQPNGADYKGRMDRTISDKICDPWQGSGLGVSSVHKNYCRAFNSSLPWCFVDNYTSTEFCLILKCENICSERSDGSDYVGELSFSIDGRSCRSWEIPTKSGHVFQEQLFPGNDRNHSYCRNPAKSQPKPWCFITNYKFKCHIPNCPTEFYHIELTNTSCIQSIPLQYMYYWNYQTDKLKEMYNETVDSDMVQKFCLVPESLRSIYGFTLLHFPNWVRITINCMELPPEYINVTSCESSTTTKSTTAQTTTATTEQETTEPSSPETNFVSDTSLGTHTPLLSATFSQATTAVPDTSEAPTSTEVPVHSTMDAIHSTTVSVTNTTNGCGCRCFQSTIFNVSKELLEDRIEKISKTLRIDTETLSATVRKLTSAEDPRPSATYVGSGAVFIFCLTFLLVILPDILNVVKFFQERISSAKLNLINDKVE